MSFFSDFFKKEKAPLYIVSVIFLSFFLFAFFLALTLRMGVSPDSHYHLEVSEAYSQTLGIPENTSETYKWKDITRIPYLSFWLNGRILNLNERMFNIDPVIVLRTFNILTSLGTLLILYLLSKQLIRNRWGRILPLFLLSNTLMFLFLSSSINYDNLTMLLCTTAIYFLVKYIKNPKELSNSLLLFVFLLLGILTKSSVLPLAFIVVIIWIVILFKNRILDKELFNQFFLLKNILFSFLFLFFLILVLKLYGVNLLTYGKLIPSCTNILTYEQCLESGVFARGVYKIPMVFSGNLVEVLKLILRGERIGPIRYFFYWVVEMSKKTYGIMGDRSLFMNYEYLLPYFAFFITSAYILFKNRKKVKIEEKAIMGVFLFYTLILTYYVNYKAYITHDWMDLGLQGRYIFPVLGIVYVVFSKYFLKIRNRKVLDILLVFLVVFFVLGNIAFFFGYVPTDWFISS